MPDASRDSNAIRAATFVRHVEIHEVLQSTNDHAVEIAHDPEIELPALILARVQTAGRGRGNNKWQATAGALTFSLLLEPLAFGINSIDWPKLSLTTAVAICDAISVELDSPAARLAIKWPNDVMLNGSKLAGILIESPGAPAKNRVVIGIGININNTMKSVQFFGHHKPIAVCDVTERQHDSLSVCMAVLNTLASRIIQMSVKDPALSDAWQKLDFAAGRDGVVEQDFNKIIGRCVKIDGDGALLMETSSGPLKIHSGSLRLA